MAATQYYVFSVDTSAGVSYTVTTNPNYNGPGTKVGGPFPTKAAAQAFISNGSASKGLGSAVLQQDQGSVGDWIVVPEGEAGKITQALAYTGTDFATALVGTLKGDLAVGGDVTVQQLTTAQQVENAETANLTLYPTKAAAQAAANTQNGQSNPTQTNPLTAIADFLSSLEQSGTWVRAAKVVLGGVLVVVGLSRLTGADKAVTAAAKGALL